MKAFHFRQYQSLEDGSQLDSKRFPNLTQCLTLMKSEAMYILLSQFTNMVVHPLYQEEDGGESSEAGKIFETAYRRDFEDSLDFR